MIMVIDTKASWRCTINEYKYIVPQRLHYLRCINQSARPAIPAIKHPTGLQGLRRPTIAMGRENQGETQTQEQKISVGETFSTGEPDRHPGPDIS